MIAPSVEGAIPKRPCISEGRSCDRTMHATVFDGNYFCRGKPIGVAGWVICGYRRDQPGLCQLPSVPRIDAGDGGLVYNPRCAKELGAQTGTQFPHLRFKEGVRVFKKLARQRGAGG